MGLPNFALARASVAFTIAGLNLASDGTYTVGSAGSFYGQLKTCKPTLKNELENASPSTRRPKNEVIIESGAAFEMEGMLFANDAVGSPTNLVRDRINNYDFVQIVLNYAGRVYTHIGPVEEYSENIKDKGTIPFNLSVGISDTGAANPVFS